MHRPHPPAAAGLVSVVLGLAGVLVDRMWSFPGTSASSAQVAAFVAARRPELVVAMVLNTLAITLWIVFAAGAHARLRRHGRHSDEVALLVFGWSTTAFVTVLFAGFAAFWVLIARAGSPEYAGLLYDLAFGLLAVSGIPTALALGAYAVLTVRSRAFSRLTARLAILAAVAHVTLLATFVARRGALSLEGPAIIAIPGTLFAWILATTAGWWPASKST